MQIEQLIKEISELSLEDKKKLNKHLLDEIYKEEKQIEGLPEEEKRNRQRIKNIKILEMMKRWEQEDDDEYYEKNKEAIEEAINVTIRK